MIERYMYIGYYNEGFKINEIYGIEILSVYAFGDMLFMYFETISVPPVDE